ncbi:MAG: Uma2 family endonuclease, partial [Chloroflexota bacterium]|nr:Uma2 family endonuclease [Chloroflexota bacterium]
MATTTTSTTGLTYDDLVALQERPEYELQQLEIIDGELFVSPSPIPFHQRVLTNALYGLEAIVRPRRLGVVFAAPLSVRFDANNVVEPDIVYVSRERLDIIGPKVIDGAPDLVMEILSPNSRQRDLVRKKNLYERFGVPEYWVIDSVAKAVSIFFLVDGRYRLVPVHDEVARSVVLPDFAITFADLFDM